ncbi:MAG: potassium channel protein [Chloroflexota bacterium]
MRSPRHLLLGGTAVVVIITAGTLGYMLLEGWPFYDALYMTVITITTVGYEETYPLSSIGRAFTMVLLIAGVGAAMYTLVAMVGFFVERHFEPTFRRRRMKNHVAHLNRHFILCGYDRVGREVARIFKNEKSDFVVVEREQDAIDKADADGCLWIQGDATDDNTLKEAGIERARGLVSTLGSDIDNTYVTLSARGLRPDIFIVARASGGGFNSKLRRAGADRVIHPETIGGRRMAMLALRTIAVDFIETLIGSHGEEFIIEELVVSGGSPLPGLKLEQARKHLGRALVIGIKRATGHFAQPSADTVLEEGDALIVIGSREQLKQLETCCNAPAR